MSFKYIDSSSSPVWCALGEGGGVSHKNISALL